MPSPVFIRVDANAQIGLGHLMRCLLLADGLKSQGIEARFLIQQGSQEVRALLAARNTAFQELGETAGQDPAAIRQILEQHTSQTLIVDGYHFDEAFLSSFAGYKVILLDDGLRSRIPPEVHVLSPIEYYDPPSEKVKAGARYALIHPKIRDHKFVLREELGRGLVFMGGSDPAGMIPWLLSQEIPPRLHLDVITGPLAGTGVQARLNQVKFLPYQKEPWGFYTQADAALVAAGSITWELAYLGVPMVLVKTADNQSALIDYFVTEGAARFAGNAVTLKGEGSLFRKHFNAEVLNRDQRRQCSETSRRMVDGFGLERAVAFILGRPFWVRRAASQDMRITFDLANDSLTRRNSFVSKVISWEEHQEWFEHRILKREDPFYLVLDANDKVMSVVRYDQLHPGEFRVSVNLSPEFRGKGLGAVILTETLHQLKHVQKARRVRALVKNDNEASLKVFQKAGYVKKGDSREYGVEASELVYEYP